MVFIFKTIYSWPYNSSYINYYFPLMWGLEDNENHCTVGQFQGSDITCNHIIKRVIKNQPNFSTC